VGVGAANPARDGWVPTLARRLPPGTRLVNLGQPGLTLEAAARRVLSRAIEADPDLVTIWLAVNDVLEGVPLERYQAGLGQLLQALREGTEAQIAVGNVPVPPATLGGITIPAFMRRTVVGRWNDAIAAEARRHEAILVDLSTRWPIDRHPEFIGPDGLHPTTAGYQALADAFYAALDEAGLL
ncbi:MAG TPA: SGNH/GDSL hydrolase family protein, partial [Chloroflexota bacterium]|nr:SGNH/GDSL hydrolase family protein [Chloroflexota bacterium]